jgi:hypothetical protein
MIGVVVGVEDFEVVMEEADKATVVTEVEIEGREEK